VRWKYVIPAVLIVLGLTVLILLFLDPLLKRAVIASGEFAFGAKVEVTSLKTKLSNLSLRIQGVQVADKDRPMQNLFEIEGLRFNVEPIPLLSRKVIIDAMSVTGVRWGTARKTSGALPPKQAAKIARRWQTLTQDGPLAKMANRVVDEGKSQITALPAAQAIQAAQSQLKNFDVKNINPDTLPMLKELDAMKAGYRQKATDYQARIQQLQVQDKLNALTPAWNEVSALKIQSPQDALAAKEKIDRLTRALGDLQNTKNSLQTLKAQAEADFSDSKSLLGKLEELKRRDLNSLAELLKVPTFDFSSLTGSILGPQWMGRLNTALGYAQKARAYMPPKSKTAKAKPVPRPRMHGLDVAFPVSNRPPDFWIKRIELSGSTGGPGKPGTPLDFQGVVTDVTPDQPQLGRPLKIALSGAQAARKLMLDAVLDHTGEIPTDRFAAEFSGLSGEEMQLPESEYLPAFKGGQAAIATRLTLNGDRLDAGLDLLQEQIAFFRGRQDEG